MYFQPVLVSTPVDTGYYDNPRAELVDIARATGACGRVLDVGCAAGRFGLELMTSGLASEVVGVEVDPGPARLAKTRLSSVIVGDLADPSTLDVLDSNFDVVIAADVLEHLVDPWTVLPQLTAHLRPGGRWIISLPNVRHYGVLRNLLLRDRWDYADSGICDSTHLRFFTTSSALGLCRSTGLDPDLGYWLVAGRSGKVAMRLRKASPFAAVQIVLSGTC